MAKQGLGKMAAKWLQAKAKEVTTANRHERDAAEYEADETARQLKNDSIGEAVMTAVPGLRKLRDRQEQQQRENEERREREEQEELASRPVAHAEVALTGAMAVTWTGTVPVRLDVVEPDPDDDPDGDPFGRIAKLVVDLGPITAPTAAPGTELLAGWRFEIPGYTGPGTYDLAASGMQRREADAEPEYIDWGLRYGEHDAAFYFQPDIGPSAVTVTAERIDITMSLTGDRGQVTASAVLEFAATPTD